MERYEIDVEVEVDGATYSVLGEATWLTEPDLPQTPVEWQLDKVARIDDGGYLHHLDLPSMPPDLLAAIREATIAMVEGAWEAARVRADEDSYR